MNINQKLNEYLTENGIKQCFVSQKTNIPKDIVSKILDLQGFQRVC